jgi:hypothetical protein
MTALPKELGMFLSELMPLSVLRVRNVLRWDLVYPPLTSSYGWKSWNMAGKSHSGWNLLQVKHFIKLYAALKLFFSAIAVFTVLCTHFLLLSNTFISVKHHYTLFFTIYIHSTLLVTTSSSS